MPIGVPQLLTEATGERQFSKTHERYQTGDLCKITIPKGKYKGTYIARIVIRHNGQFDFRANRQRITTNWKNCKILQKGDGYDYAARVA